MHNAKESKTCRQIIFLIPKFKTLLFLYSFYIFLKLFLCPYVIPPFLHVKPLLILHRLLILLTSALTHIQSWSNHLLPVISCLFQRYLGVFSQCWLQTICPNKDNLNFKNGSHLNIVIIIICPWCIVIHSLLNKSLSDHSSCLPSIHKDKKN